MKPETFVRTLAGTMILVSLALGHLHHSGWHWLTAFVGLNLIQSAYTGFCPPCWLAGRLGWLKEDKA